MSDDIPIIFTEELRRADPATQPVAVFLSAAGASQMQQYATAGWKVLTLAGFRSPAPINLSEVPALEVAPSAVTSCTLLSCEAPYLGGDTAGHIKALQPDVLKMNCAFHDVADAAGLARTMTGLGYHVAAAVWRDDNSFGYRSLSGFGPLDSLPNIEWDRTNLIGIRDAGLVKPLLTVARLYVGEERRIADLRVANTIRNDYIARLEDALMAHQVPPKS